MTDHLTTGAPTLEEKKARLERLLRQRAGSRRVPASYAQRRMWLLTALEPDAPNYNLHYALRMRGPLDTTALEAALARVIRRHESLRTTFEAVDGQPEQVVHADLSVPVKVVDLSGLPAGERAGRARRMAVEERRKPFDLGRGPLLRATLQRLASDEHILFLVLHHIVADGWSIGLLLRELGQQYDACRHGHADPLAPLPLQFSDFTRMQLELLAGDTLRTELDYWKKRLADLPAPLDLPVDGRRVATPTREAALCSHVLGAARLDALKQLSRAAGVTPYATVLMVLAVLLRRICGEEDVVVGSPIAARTIPHTEKLIGFFVNMLVMRTSLSGNPTFRALLEQLREVTRGAFGHQDLPFERLLEELNPERDPGRTPLFQVYLNMLNFQESVPAFAGLETEVLPPYEMEANFDLTLYVREQGGGLELSFVYPRGLFSEQRIEELLRQFEAVLVAAIEDPDRRIGDVSLVTGHSRPLLPDPAAPLVSAIGTPATLDARHLPAIGERIALSGPDGDWTARELDARADRLARLLVRSGLQRGEVVAVHARRDPWLVCALLGVLRAGGAFAIFDPAYPDSTLVARWRAARPHGLVLLGDGPGAELEACIAQSDLKVRLDLPRDALAAESAVQDGRRLPAPRADDLAYVVFTSGTTGGVKAVLGTHGPVAHFLNWQKETFGLGAADRFSLLSGLSHDPLLRDVFAPLLAGGTLAVPRPELLAEPAELAAWMRAERVTVAHLTPAMADMLATATQPGDLDALRYAFLAGDVLRSDTVAELRRAGAGITCVNFYGATETPQAMSWHVVPPQSGELQLPERIPVGRGIEGVELLVLSGEGRLAGVSELGEIAVRTPYLSRGYLGDSELTSARFARNPFSDAEGDLVYRTGDLGRYLPDGSVAFAGRRDTQVKLRGFRVELGEIEAALCRHPGVTAAAAGLKGERPGDERLVAWVVPADSGVAVAELRAFLAKRLPDYAVPAAWAMLDALPLTPNGKLDRRALQAPPPEREPPGFERPQSPIEELVAGVYAEVLGVPRVGRLDGFFEQGGHSLLAAQAVARLNARLGVQLSLRTLFERTTPAALAAHLETLLQQEGGRRPALLRRASGEPPALSFAQQRLWFIHELAPEIAAYNLAGALEFRGPLDVAALSAALEHLVARHETLRTTIGQAGGQPVQVVRAAVPCPLERVPLECTDGELASRLRDETVRPFNLEAGPLLRVTLYQREAQRHVLLLVAHHIIADGWSMGVLARELGELYRAFAAGLAPTLAPLPVQYGDFASWQRTWLAGEALERELEYWRRQLAGAPAALELPTDRPRPAMFSHRGARYHFTLPRELADALSALSRREGVTLFMTLLAAFQVLLSRYSGQDDLVIGSPVANRSRPEIEGLIGFFVNTLVLRTALSNVRSFRELLFRVRETCLGAYAHQELPFEKLVQELKPERDTSRNPLFQVMLVLQNMALPPLDLGAVSVVPLDIERTTSQVDLTLYLRETGDGLLGTFEYATDLFNAVTIEGMARHLQRLLQGFAEAPEADLTIPLMPDEECRALLHRYDTRQDYPRDRTVVELIEAQAARRPAARALRHEQAELDYAGLTARSNRLAAYLRSRGLGPGSLVGVCVERGIDMVVSLLAILKAGAAYLPLDPAFPAERLHYMLEDSGAKALVTHATLDQELFSGVDLCRIRLDGDRDAIEQQSPEPLAAAGPGPLDRAYVIYTSGSTGRPKGVEIPHGALTNFLCSMAREPGLTADDVLVAVTTISFDISLLELFLPLTVGGRVVLADREQVADAARLAALLQASAATAMQATPSLWRLLVDSGWQGGGHFKVLCGGEPLPPDLARALSERSGELWNLYGPTETTVWSTCERIRSLDGPLSIGKPIANTRVYVLDERLEPVPPLVAGELFIAGDGVATGYLHRPELTAERFLPDRFATNDAEGRMYRTGDKARWLQDGRLEHLGRLDNQVKLRGFRIEVGEIETVLRSHSAVHEAAVAVWQAGAADQRLVAYVVPTSGTPPIADLRKHLRSRLPDYMIPQHFIVQDALPLTPNGKLDRRALPPPLQQPSGTGEVAEPPVGATEVLIADIWKQVIGCAAVSRDDNFFDAGGHSMLAIEAIARIEERTGWRPSPRLLILESLKEIALQCDQAVRRPATERNLLSRLKGLVRAGD